MDYLKNRSEFLFIYDVTDSNPNGDPLDENKPRIDEESGQVIVTDVRLKRTIRDYLLKLIHEKDARISEQDIFVKEVRDEEGYLYDAKARARQFLTDIEGKFHEMKKQVKDTIAKECIDVRLFGAVVPIEFKVKDKPQTGSIIMTGPVQFNFGRSLHKVDLNFIKGTGAFADKYDEKTKKTQFTFREEWIVPYALIAFYGVANEYAAQTTHLTESDLGLMLEAMWNGTKDLITRSKFGQIPRLLVRIVYKADMQFYIGELDRLVKWIPNNGYREGQVRDIAQGVLDVTQLINAIEKYKDKVERVEIALNERLHTSPELLIELNNRIGKDKIQTLELS